MATLLHLPWPKFHPPSSKVGARLHSSLLHPHRTCTVHLDRARLERRRQTDKPRECEAAVPSKWRWNLGYAMLPLRYRLHAERTLDGFPRLWVEPFNRSVPQLYGLLHRRKEDNRYCEALPCGTASGAASPLGSAAPEAARGSRANMHANMSTCHSMKACFAGEGGRYFYMPDPEAP